MTSEKETLTELALLIEKRLDQVFEKIDGQPPSIHDKRFLQYADTFKTLLEELDEIET